MQPTVANRQPRTLLFLAFLALASCATAPVGPLPDADGVTREFLYTPFQSDLISTTPDDISQVVQDATSRSYAEIAEHRRTQEIRLDQLAYFFRSADGRAYLLAEGPKAIVRGAPQGQCPVEVSMVGGGNAQASITQALQSCHEDLSALGLQDSCDCRLLAQGTILHAAPATFEYAVDLPVRLFRDGRLDPVTYFSRAGSDGTGTRAILVELGDTQLMAVSYSDPGARHAVVTYPDGTQIPAERAPVGYDRGRLRESFTTTQQDGTPLRIIVGP